MGVIMSEWCFEQQRKEPAQNNILTYIIVRL